MEDNKYKSAIEALLERKNELVIELKSLNTHIDYFKSKIANSIPDTLTEVKVGTTKGTPTPKGYNKSLSIAKKFAYLLKTHNRFLHFREAANMINELDGGGLDISDLTGKLSSGTQTLKSNRQIVKYKFGKGNRNSFWGIPSWLNDNGEIKEGHVYSKDYVHTKSKSSVDLFEGL